MSNSSYYTQERLVATARFYLAKRLKVAAYARVSTDSDEQAESLETQKSHYEHLIGARADW